MIKIGIPFKNPGTNSKKSDPVPMFGIHVGMNFKHETTHGFFFRMHYSLFRFTRQRCWSNFHETIQKFSYPKIIHRASIKYRTNFSVQIILTVKFRINPKNCFKIFRKLLVWSFPNDGGQLWIMNILYHHSIFSFLLSMWSKMNNFLLI